MLTVAIVDGVFQNSFQGVSRILDLKESRLEKSVQLLFEYNIGRPESYVCLQVL